MKMDWSTLQQQDEAIHLQLAQFTKWKKQKEILDKQLKHAEQNVDHYRFPNGKALTFRFGMKVRSDKECQLWRSNYLNFLRIFVAVF